MTRVLTADCERNAHSGSRTYYEPGERACANLRLLPPVDFELRHVSDSERHLQSIGALLGVEDKRVGLQSDLTPIQDALLHEELPKLRALALEALARIASRAELARDTGVWPQVRFEFEDFVDEAERRLRQIRGEQADAEDHPAGMGFN